MGTEVTAAGLTDVGLKRRVNEDSVVCLESAGMHLFCVADGMGGHAHGEKASGEIAERTKEWGRNFYPQKYESDFMKIADDFENCLQNANQNIYERYNRDEICGSTLAALLIYDRYYAVFSLGDSRIYRMRKRKFEQITRDDTWQNSVGGPAGSEEEPLSGDSRYGKLVAAVGIEKRVVFHRMTDRLRRGDLFLLCSDGIYRTCDFETLRRACRGSILRREGPEERLQRMKACAYQHGAPDNLSAVLVRVDRVGGSNGCLGGTRCFR